MWAPSCVLFCTCVVQLAAGLFFQVKKSHFKVFTKPFNLLISFFPFQDTFVLIHSSDQKQNEKTHQTQTTKICNI